VRMRGYSHLSQKNFNCNSSACNLDYDYNVSWFNAFYTQTRYRCATESLLRKNNSFFGEHILASIFSPKFRHILT
jgi:hypothetical protein